MKNYNKSMPKRLVEKTVDLVQDGKAVCHWDETGQKFFTKVLMKNLQAEVVTWDDGGRHVLEAKIVENGGKEFFRARLTGGVGGGEPDLKVLVYNPGKWENEFDDD